MSTVRAPTDGVPLCLAPWAQSLSRHDMSASAQSSASSMQEIVPKEFRWVCVPALDHELVHVMPPFWEVGREIWTLKDGDTIFRMGWKVYLGEYTRAQGDRMYMRRDGRIWQIRAMQERA